MLIIALVLGIVGGLFAGGRITNIASVRLQFVWLLFLGLVIRYATQWAIEAGIPGKKSGPPEDLVGTLLLLCSKAGDWINGQSISVDGGWVMRL